MASTNPYTGAPADAGRSPNPTKLFESLNASLGAMIESHGALGEAIQRLLINGHFEDEEEARARWRSVGAALTVARDATVAAIAETNHCLKRAWQIRPALLGSSTRPGSDEPSEPHGRGLGSTSSGEGRLQVPPPNLEPDQPGEPPQSTPPPESQSEHLPSESPFDASPAVTTNQAAGEVFVSAASGESDGGK